MTEYIEREALLELYADAPNMKYDAFSVPIPVIRQNIKDMPAADVAPVVHGEWKFCGSDRWNDAFECSECGKIAMDNSDFCPNCGAKMDGGADNGK